MGSNKESIMKREQRPLYAIAAAVLVVGLLFAGVPPIFLLLLACPLMMIFMMRGMGHGGTNHEAGTHDHGDSSAGRENSSGHHHSGR
jgi:type III secretory pathway component EscV